MRAYDGQLDAAPRRSPEPRADTVGAPSLASAVLGLNQTAGNAAAARAVQRFGGKDDELAGAGASPGLGASAYTGGSDIAFGGGAGGGGGDLMAHEASHITQQGPGAVGGAAAPPAEEEE